MAPRQGKKGAAISIKKENVMEWLKSLLASWKVRIALVGGALVVATTYGTCSFEPALVSTNDSVSGTAATTTTETVSTSTEGTTEGTTSTTAETSTTTTGTTDTTETTNSTNTTTE